MTTQFVTAAAMREADRRCIEDIGIPGAVLMNSAGTAVFREIDQSPVAVICGKGNNGGDGFVVARLALLAGLEVHVFLVAAMEDIKGDAQTFLNAYLRLGGTIDVVTDLDGVNNTLEALGDYAILVDSLLGTGIRGEVRGLPRAMIDGWPPLQTVAVDLPSGLDADSGAPCGACVQAQTTVTFQWAKTGFKSPVAQKYLGRVVVADIGIPACCIENMALPGG